MRRLSIIPLVLLALACASGGTSRPKTIAQPGIEVFMTHDVFFGSQAQAPATIEVRVLNRSAEPIKVLRAEVYSPTMSQWAIRRTSRTFNETIAPGETKSVTIFATAVTTVSRPDEPLVLTALIDFEAGEARWREHVIGR
ncbi:MAG TPA: hypothetical protein VNA69_17870 [Thermoanaerobaculia bacterium]|nr:hypothetical protein [Thermoanaerobaculia bacterium]